jgi:hypothetical protein
MGKRSTFDRRERDFYPTPYEAVISLLPHLYGQVIYHEPCCGNLDLILHLKRHGHICAEFGDIDQGKDAFDIQQTAARFFITNPPWRRDILHPLITHLRNMRPTWLLFDADWMHTKQAATHLQYCQRIVSVGRLKWIPDTPHKGKDSCAWYLFQATKIETKFFGQKVAA